MSDNPFQAPQSTGVAESVSTEQREFLRTVAISQKAIMACIVLQILAIALQFVAPSRFAGIGQVVVGILTVIFLIQLATRLYGEKRGILLGLLGFAPLISLIVLLIVSRKATKLLQDHGVRVRLLGADLREI